MAEIWVQIASYSSGRTVRITISAIRLRAEFKQPKALEILSSLSGNSSIGIAMRPYIKFFVSSESRLLEHISLIWETISEMQDLVLAISSAERFLAALLISIPIFLCSMLEIY